MTSDDACFDGGAKRLVFDRVRHVDLLFGLKFTKLLTAAVGTDHSDDRNAIDELAEIARDVGGAAWIKRFARDFDNRHGRLRRDAADFSPNEFVEHQVTNYQYALGRGAVENLVEAGEIHKKSDRRCRRDEKLVRFRGVKMCDAAICVKRRFCLELPH